ncbi:competence protein ComEC [Enhydrobacter aerosaccus]|uniref:Competence protein ComEC n=1 Tax=Enhydrobacter aerosaccus TaxID=225324 RepID=A0A1T4KYK9_9HYPH|nr:ComEC/Rec2 family competence protein [Enhydrobacter aerosaccus]SJZ47532.1 competence protein ComEC [Enhydrobacter aerosaccus]
MSAARNWLLAQIEAERGRWMLWLPVAMGLGIAIYFELPSEPAIWLGPVLAAAGVAIAALVPGGTFVRALCFGLIAACIGFGLAAWRTATLAAPVLGRPLFSINVEGRIADIQRLPEGVRVVLEAVRLKGRGAPAPEATPARLRISLSRGAPPIEVGDRLLVLANLSPPAGPATPGAFDFQRVAWFQQIGGVGYAIAPAAVIEHGRPKGFVRAIDALRAAITARILAALPGPEGGVAAALLTGEQSAVSREITQSMRDSGLAHILSISGLHIVFVVGLVMGVLRYAIALVPPLALRVDAKKISAVLALMVALFYTALAGAPVPAQRSCAMAAFALLAILLDRTALSLRLVAWSAVIVLLAAPDALTGASFQMSFAAVIALIAAWEAGARWRRSLHEWVEQSAHPWLWRLLAGLGASLATTLIASIATGAFAAYHFNRLSFLGVGANLLGVPLTGFWIMPWGLLAMLLMPLGLEKLALVPMGWGIDGLDAIAAHVSSWPQAAMLVPSLPGASLWLFTMGGLWLCLWRRRWRLAGVPIGAIGLLLGPGPAPDLLMSEDGRVLGLRDGHGTLQVASARTDRFVTEAWARRSGQDGARKWMASAEEQALGLGCQTGLCRWQKGPWKVALVSDDQRLAEACASSDIVLSTVDAQGRCRGPRLVIDRRDAWREGAQALWLEDSGLRRATANGARGDRPWVSNSPSRQAVISAPGI